MLCFLHEPGPPPCSHYWVVWRRFQALQMLVTAKSIKAPRRRECTNRRSLDSFELRSLVRFQGPVDDLKIDSSQWREMSDKESFAIAFATVLVCLSAALAGNTSKARSFACSVAILSLWLCVRK
ncbi:hypothetical protein EDD85DRAFT_865631 [Armillaria nabsnona]|nr:hypothetical protein EDD85DRAFT_865631 [Armillaria nabsnona]